MSVISGVVPTKTTGQIDETGGSLSLAERFPENLIDRNSNPSCLDSTFADYGVVKGSEHVPDIASHLNHRHAFKAASHCAKKGKHQIATLGFPLSFFFIGHLSSLAMLQVANLLGVVLMPVSGPCINS